MGQIQSATDAFRDDALNDPYQICQLRAQFVDRITGLHVPSINIT